MPRLDLMKLLPTRTWGAIVIHSQALGLDRKGALQAQGINSYPGFGKGTGIPYTMSYVEYIAQQNTPDNSRTASGFDLNVLADNLSD